MDMTVNACRRRALTGGVAALLAVMPVASSLADTLTRMVSLTGHCTSLMAMNSAGDPGFCSDKLINFDYPNGRIGFVFLVSAGTSDAAVISFFGSAQHQTHTDDNHAVQPIDRVHFTFQGGTDDFIAKGVCRFENPYLGKPAEIACTATTSAGQFIGKFLSNGIAPDMTEVR